MASSGWRPQEARQSPHELVAAVRLHRRALRTRGGAGPDRQHARRAVDRLGLDPGRGRTAAAPAGRRRPRPWRCRRGGALQPDRADGAARARHPVPSHAARDQRSGGERAPAGDVVPRGPDVVLPGGLRSDPPVLHHPGLCRGLRGLCGQLGIRAGLPLRAVGPVGRRRFRGLPRRGLAPGRAGGRGRAADGRPGQQRGRHDGPQRTGGGGGVRGLRRRGTGSPTCWGWWRPRTISRPTTPIG